MAQENFAAGERGFQEYVFYEAEDGFADGESVSSDEGFVDARDLEEEEDDYEELYETSNQQILLVLNDVYESVLNTETVRYQHISKAECQQNKFKFVSYIKSVEYAYTRRDGTTLSGLLSINNDHISYFYDMYNVECLILINAVCEIPDISKILKCHVLSAKAILEQDWLRAFAHQIAYSVFFLFFLHGAVRYDWTLPVMRVIAKELRQIACLLGSISEPELDIAILDITGETILHLFRLCSAPNSNCRAGMHEIGNELFFIFLDLKEYDPRLPTMRHPFDSTFAYLFSRLTDYDAYFLKLGCAEDYLAFAFERCPKDRTDIKRKILVRLEALRLQKGFTCTRAQHEKYDLIVFTDLNRAIKYKDLRRFNRLVEDYRELFKLHGIYEFMDREIRAVAQASAYFGIIPTKKYSTYALYPPGPRNAMACKTVTNRVVIPVVDDED